MATVHLRPMATGSRLTLLTCLLLLLLLVATSITCVAAAEESERLDIVHAMSLSYYELLGIPTTATAKEIKKAYRTVALRYHPDKYSDDSGRDAVHALFLRINAANEALGSDTIRPQYDQLLADGVVDWSDHEYKLLLRRQDEQQYGRYRAYAMRAARGDIEWGELAVMAFSLLCAVGPLVKWQWSEWKKRERAKEKAKESVRRGKRDVESRMKEQQRIEEELAKRRAAAVRLDDSDDDDDDDDAADSEERRREKEARRARVKKARAAVKVALSPYTLEVDSTEESKATIDGAADKLPSEDVELLVRGLPVEALEQLWTQMETVRADEKRRITDKTAAIRQLFNEQFAPLAAARLQEQLLAQQAAASTSSSSGTAATSSRAAATSGKSREWSLVELSYLAKGMAKWPGGVSQRWDKITAYINSSMDAHTDADTQQPVTQRQRRAVKDVLARVKLEELRAAKGKPDHVDTPRLAPAQPASQSAADAGGGGGVGVEKKSKDEWSDEEQSAFESALRTVPRDVDDRWERIAALVSSKSKAQCIRRFKEIRAQILASTGKADTNTG